MTAQEQLRARSFAATLASLLHSRGWNQSDLARHVWGTREEKDGRESAAGRDKVSRYMKGVQLPDPKTLKQMADALGVTIEELAPDIAAEVAERAPPAMLLSQPEGRPDLIHLQLNLLLPAELAVKVAQIVTEAQKQSKLG